ncbi:class II aldolase/adducin family protein [Pararobbsia silviterrae]|uniref:Class II aldolase/adducin family protein n=1 Tax=Pararobbsia silviterrae TaxID=1792498 RepID=A0A494X624_9BURK|nr:class II aldolase/adducin family protein [Pararobbsia silviterrae]RKP46128.1 class II aldolase/adducin family protein [Pararobbsia silviterrae]
MDTPSIDAGSRLLALKHELVAANRILAHQGVLDAFGHVSARHPERPGEFLISRSCAPELVEIDDIITMRLDGSISEGADAKPYLEVPIHAEIYRARPDVRAVVHSHAPAVIPFGIVTQPLRPVYHMAGFLAKGAPVFDIRACFGCTDMLVRRAEQGAALAQALGSSAIALMRGHGFVATSTSIPGVVYRAIYTERNATIQQQAIALGGPVTYLDEDEALQADDTNMGAIGKPWALWKRYADRLKALEKRATLDHF